MSLDAIFSAGNLLAMTGWAALILLPGFRPARLYAGLAVPLLLGTAYAALIGADFAASEGGFGSLQAVAELFRSPALLTAGWLHYLAFDLLVGSFEVETARRERMPHVHVVPCLVLTFLFGPLGFLLFIAIRFARRAASRNPLAVGASS